MPSWTDNRGQLSALVQSRLAPDARQYALLDDIHVVSAPDRAVSIFEVELWVRSTNARSKEERGDARVQCKTEASRVRRAVASDRSANDIAKQVKMNRKREKSPEHVKKGSV